MASRNVAPEAIEIRLNGPRPAFLRKVELMAKFFVSMALRANYAPWKWGLFIRFDSEMSAVRAGTNGCCGRGSGREG